MHASFVPLRRLRCRTWMSSTVEGLRLRCSGIVRTMSSANTSKTPPKNPMNTIEKIVYRHLLAPELVRSGAYVKFFQNTYFIYHVYTLQGDPLRNSIPRSRSVVVKSYLKILCQRFLHSIFVYHDRLASSLRMSWLTTIRQRWCPSSRI